MDIIFEPGKLLFHGTSEEFPAKEIQGGGYDKVIWTAETPDIAQNYIPISGVSTAISARYLTRPQKGSVIQQLQRKLGIEYDYSTIEWDYMDRATSFYYPQGWDKLPEEDEVVERLESLGYEKESYGMYKIRMTYIADGSSRLMLPGEKTIGRLFFFKAKQPLKIFDFTLGGEREGDLMNVDYHRIDIFRAAEKKGYDGIKINDFAQSEVWGNLGHTSIGLFEQALSKLRWGAIMATNYDWQNHDDFQAATTPEWETFKRLMGLL